ncbi:MAG: DMT family transporter [Salinivirgaceae bacterium]|nr:DMT family transporter [Salinivirgaceae bacterium]
MVSSNTKSFLALIMGAILIAFSPVLIKMTGVAGTLSVFYRMFFGTLTLIIPFSIARFRSKTKLPIKGILIATLAGLFLSIDMAMWAAGIMASNAAMPTLVSNLAPLWVGIGAFFIFKERKSINFWTGLILALIGVSFLIIHDLYFPTGIFKGLILGLFSGMFYAGFMLLTQPGRKLLDTLSYLFISTAATAIFLGIFGLIQGLTFTGFATETWIIFIIMGIVLQAGAWFLINFAQGYLPASLVAPTLLTQPVLTAFIAFFMLGEMLTKWHVLGGIIVLIGIYMVHLKKKK